MIERLGAKKSKTGTLWDFQAPPGRPTAVIECQEGAADIRIDLTNSGGDVTTRRCTVGGGWNCVINAGYWLTCNIEIIGLSAGAIVSIAWVNECNSDSVYYLAQTLGVAPGPVPAGAYQVLLDVADANFQWSNSVAVTTHTVNVPADTLVPVAGNNFQPSAPNRAVWVIRGF